MPGKPRRGSSRRRIGGRCSSTRSGSCRRACRRSSSRCWRSKSVRRLGSTRSEAVDVWLLAATSEDLEAAVRARRFREDLYHRLAVVTLRLPPLRERGEDILRLAEHFLRRACEDYGLPPKTLTGEARATLLGYPWPGNVRELGNVMERVALLVGGDRRDAGDSRVAATPQSWRGGARGRRGAARGEGRRTRKLSGIVSSARSARSGGTSRRRPRSWASLGTPSATAWRSTAWAPAARPRAVQGSARRRLGRSPGADARAAVRVPGESRAVGRPLGAAARDLPAGAARDLRRGTEVVRAQPGHGRDGRQGPELRGVVDELSPAGLVADLRPRAAGGRARSRGLRGDRDPDGRGQGASGERGPTGRDPRASHRAGEGRSSSRGAGRRRGCQASGLGRAGRAGRVSRRWAP